MLKEITVSVKDYPIFKQFCDNLLNPIQLKKREGNTYTLSQDYPDIIQKEISLQQYFEGCQETYGEDQMSCNFFIALMIKILRDIKNGYKKKPVKNALQLYNLEAENVLFYEDEYFWHQGIFYFNTIEKELDYIKQGKKPLSQSEIVNCIKKIIEKAINQENFLKYEEKKGEGEGEREEEQFQKQIQQIQKEDNDNFNSDNEGEREEVKYNQSNFLNFLYQSDQLDQDEINANNFPLKPCLATTPLQFAGLKTLSTSDPSNSIKDFIKALAVHQYNSKYFLQNTKSINIDLNYFNRRLILLKKKLSSTGIYQKPIDLIKMVELGCSSKINIDVDLMVNSKIKDKRLLSKLSNGLDSLWKYDEAVSDSEIFYQEFINCIIIESMSQYDANSVNQDVSQESTINLGMSSHHNNSIRRAVEENLFQKHLYYVYVSLMKMASKYFSLSDVSQKGFSIVISTIKVILKKKYLQAGDDLNEYCKYFALPEFKTCMEEVAKEIIGYLQTEGCQSEHQIALKVRILRLEDFKENMNYFQVDSVKKIIKPPNGRINNYLKMIKDLNSRID